MKIRQNAQLAALILLFSFTAILKAFSNKAHKAIKDRYSEVFQAFGSNLPDFAVGMGMTLQKQNQNIAKYEISHQNSFASYSLPFVFVKADDRNWKI
ncbi:MAG: hypothetical protein WCZ89_08795 [Phycisphaerae bacterium]